MSWCRQCYLTCHCRADAASAVAVSVDTFLSPYLEIASTASAVAASVDILFSAHLEAASAARDVAVSASTFVSAYFDAVSAASAECGKAFYDAIAGSGTARILAMLQPHGVSLVSPDRDTAQIPLEQ